MAKSALIALMSLSAPLALATPAMAQDAPAAPAAATPDTEAATQSATPAAAEMTPEQITAFKSVGWAGEDLAAAMLAAGVTG